MSYSYNYRRQGQLARVALYACKIASMVAFCLGVNLVLVLIWVANDIDSRINWITWDAH